ncbi:MAG: o-succinylbenzoate synthase, partial [candidate division Zixibacteria bacterium]|nr:o-succinylbenzoate synthase [candidate division Zixibacteria bacterium]
LKRPDLGGHLLQRRRGIIVELRDEIGRTAFGEVAPLVGFSRESLDDAEHQLTRLRFSVTDAAIPDDLEELSGGFERWLGAYDLSPSVRFGFEAATLSLIAARRGVQLCRLISDHPLDKITVNALLTGEQSEILERAGQLRNEGWRAFKLKVGRRAVDDDIRLTREVRQRIGPDAILRLDANQRYSHSEFAQFAEAVRECDIDYIEEPLSSLADLQVLLEASETPLPLALDETLQIMKPEDLHRCHKIKAIVLKPTMLGLERAAQFARVAIGCGVETVISSSFESGVGLVTLAQVAAGINATDIPVGLDTSGWFERDLLSSALPIAGGVVVINKLPDVAKEIDHEMLQELGEV